MPIEFDLTVDQQIIPEDRRQSVRDYLCIRGNFAEIERLVSLYL
jgi:hypothetical protein